MPFSRTMRTEAARRVRGRERHRVRQRLDGFARIGEPCGEQGDGIAVRGDFRQRRHGRILPWCG